MKKKHYSASVGIFSTCLNTRISRNLAVAVVVRFYCLDLFFFSLFRYFLSIRLLCIVRSQQYYKCIPKFYDLFLSTEVKRDSHLDIHGKRLFYARSGNLNTGKYHFSPNEFHRNGQFFENDQMLGFSVLQAHKLRTFSTESRNRTKNRQNGFSI